VQVADLMVRNEGIPDARISKIRRMIDKMTHGGVGEFNYPISGDWKQPYEYWNNGKCTKLVPERERWQRKFLANYKLPGYCAVGIISDNLEIQKLFEVGGICVLYYDPKVWQVDDG